MKWILVRCSWVLLAILIFSSVARALMVDGESQAIKSSHEVDLDFLSKVQILSDQYKFNMANYIPLSGLPQNDDGNIIAKRIVRFSAQNLLDNHKNFDSPALKNAAKINQNMKAQVGTPANSVQFRVKPIEGLASVTYKGELPIQSSIQYEVARNELRFEISHPIGNKTLALTHIDDSNQRTDLLGLRWGF